MHYDGAVLINTELGTEDLEKDIKEVSGELGGLKGVLQKFGKTIADAFSKPVARASKEVQKDIDDCAKAIERYRAQIQKAQAAKLPFEEQTREMGAELDEAQRKLAELQAQKATAEKAMQLPEGRAQTGDEISAYLEAQAQLPAIQAEIEKQHAAVDNLEKKWNAACDKVDKYNNEIRQSEDLIAANEAKAEELAKELKEAEAAAKGLKKNSKDTQSGMDKAGKSVRSFTSRLKSIALGALVFNGISAGLRTMTDHFGKCLKTNDAFTTALSQCKGALLTAFQPIYQAVAPALTYLTKLLTAAVLAVARLFATLTGTSLEASADAAENLYEEAEALDQVGSSAKKAGKSLAGFDDLNVMQKTDQTGGGSSNEVKPAFSWDDAEMDEMTDVVKKIAKYAGVAAAGFAGFKIGKFVTDLLTANKTLKSVGQKAGMKIGITLAVTGLALEAGGIIDTIQNGMSGENLSNILFGGGALAGGAALIGKSLGKALVGGAIGGIVASVPAFFTSVYDAMENGLNWLNGTLTAASATAAGASIGALFTPLFGPVSTGVGALIGFGVGLFTDGILAAGERYKAVAVDTLSETEKALVARAKQSADAFVNQVAETEAEIKTISSETGYLEKLADELLGLVDAEGKVQEKDQARFDFLSTKLNDALGTEITRTGDLVTGYQNLGGSIEEAINKKRAMAMLEAYEDDWIQAMNDEQEAIKANSLLYQDYQAQLEASQAKQAEFTAEKEKLLQRQIELEARYGDVAGGQLKDYYDTEMTLLQDQIKGYEEKFKAEQELIDDKKAKYDESQAALELYHSQVQKYETASMQAMQGNYQEAVNILSTTGEAYHQLTDKVDEETARKLDALWAAAKDAELAAKDEKEGFEKGLEGFTEESVKEAEEGYKKLMAAYEKAYDDAYSVGSDTGEGLFAGLKSKENPILKLAGNIGSGIEQAIRKALDSHSPARKLVAVGEDADDGLIVGMKNNEGDVIKAAENVAESMVDAYGEQTAGVENIAEDTLSVWGKLTSKAADFGRSFSERIADGIYEAIPNIAKAASSALRSANNALGNQGYVVSAGFTTPPVPWLAQGAVLPANKPFMAVVGDQRHGTNVEAPLTTIQEALDLALADRLEGMMAGFSAVTARQEQILAAILSLDVSDGALAGAVERYQREMAIATGGI